MAAESQHKVFLGRDNQLRAVEDEILITSEIRHIAVYTVGGLPGAHTLRRLEVGELIGFFIVLHQRLVELLGLIGAQRRHAVEAVDLRAASGVEEVRPLRLGPVRRDLEGDALGGVGSVRGFFLLTGSRFILLRRDTGFIRRSAASGEGPQQKKGQHQEPGFLEEHHLVFHNRKSLLL